MLQFWLKNDQCFFPQVYTWQYDRIYLLWSITRQDISESSKLMFAWTSLSPRFFSSDAPRDIRTRRYINDDELNALGALLGKNDSSHRGIKWIPPRTNQLDFVETTNKEYMTPRLSSALYQQGSGFKQQIHTRGGQCLLEDSGKCHIPRLLRL